MGEQKQEPVSVLLHDELLWGLKRVRVIEEEYGKYHLPLLKSVSIIQQYNGEYELYPLLEHVLPSPQGSGQAQDVLLYRRNATEFSGG